MYTPIETCIREALRTYAENDLKEEIVDHRISGIPGREVEFFVTLKGTTFESRVLLMDFDHSVRGASIKAIVAPILHRGLGKLLIGKIFECCRKHRYRLRIVGLVESFYRRLIARGAIHMDPECVEITEKTDLRPLAHYR